MQQIIPPITNAFAIFAARLCFGVMDSTYSLYAWSRTFCLRRMTLWINFSAFAHLMFWLNCFVWWLVVPWFFLPYIFLLLE